MNPVLVLRHGANIPAGYLGDALAAAGVPVATAALDAGAVVPDRLDWAGVVSLGGQMGAYEEERYPFLPSEKAFLRAAAGAGVPVLGICLGCQLLADALGGRAYRAPSLELGHFAVTLTEAGAADPVTAHLDKPTLVWHQDTWDLPPGAELLGESDRYPMAFRLGNALGIQPHPEVSPEIAKDWAEMEGVEIDDVLAAMDAGRVEGEAMARALFTAWVEEIS